MKKMMNNLLGKPMADLVLMLLTNSLINWLLGGHKTGQLIGITVIIWFLLEVVTLLDDLVKIIKDKKATINIHSDNVTLNTKEEEA